MLNVVDIIVVLCHLNIFKDQILSGICGGANVLRIHIIVCYRISALVTIDSRQRRTAVDAEVVAAKAAFPPCCYYNSTVLFPLPNAVGSQVWENESLRHLWISKSHQ